LTTVPTSGGAGCSGAEEYNGYIYWATESYLHRIAIADADGQWVNGVQNWNAFDVTDDTYHPMAIQDQSLFIADGNQIAMVDDATFDSEVFKLTALSHHRISAMTSYEFDIFMGTYVADTVNEGRIIRWDTVSPSWNLSDEISEAGINAFIKDDNYLYVNAGKEGNMYYFDGARLQLFKKVPGTYSNTKTGVVYPGSVANYQGVPIFGFSNVLGNPAPQGVYSLGSYSRDYSKVLSLDWPISQGVTSGIKMGALAVMNGLIYAAWTDGTESGIDKLDASTKYNGAYIATKKLFTNKRHILKTMAEANVYYDSLPTGTSFTIYYKVNNGSYIALSATEAYKDAIANAYKGRLTVPEVGSLQTKIVFNTSGNNSPTLETLEVN